MLVFLCRKKSFFVSSIAKNKAVVSVRTETNYAAVFKQKLSHIQCNNNLFYILKNENDSWQIVLKRKSTENNSARDNSIPDTDNCTGI